MRGLIASLVSIALAGPAFGQAAALTRIGAAGAVKGLVNAQAPGAPAGRVIESGKTMFENDHVTTDAAGRLQVLLLDETVFTLGPNSDMVLDKFVYDPSNHEGQVAAQVTKGVFRFVTGQVARKDPKNMTVKLPSGTIGIRGTIVIGQVDGDKTTVILGGPGGHGNTDESRGAFLFDGKMVEEPGYGITCEGGKCSGVRELSELANRLNAVLSVAASGPQHSESDSSGTESSGQKTASSKGDSLQQLVDEDASQTQTQLQTATANDPRGMQDGLSTWDQMRNATQLGTVHFQSPNASGICTGSACSSLSTFNYDFNMDVNFASRQIQNGNIQISGNTGVNDSTTFSSNFGTTGAASVTFGTLTGGSGGHFNGTSISFLNAGGEIAKQATMNLQYSNSFGNGVITNVANSATR